MPFQRWKLNKIIVYTDTGKYFSSEGFLSLEVTWGTEDVNLDLVPCSKCIEIKQEAAFRTNEDDERFKEQESVILHCHHISPAGVKSKLGVITISLEKSKTSRKVFTIVFFFKSAN